MTAGAASAWRSVAALTAMELRLALRRGESLVVTIALPAAVLLFFGSVDLLPLTRERLVPASVAISIVATGLVSLGISTAYDRYYGVLKRLGGAPVPRWGIVGAKLLAAVVTVVLQLVLLLAIAVVALGWRPASEANPVVFGAAVVLGTAAFASLGLMLAGRLRADLTLAVANGLFVGLLLAGGLLVPPSELPEPLGSIATVLPSGALVESLAAGLGVSGAALTSALAPLAVWAAALAAAAASSFRVE